MSAGSHTLAQVASAYDVSPRTLLFYENQGLLRPALFGAERVYDENDRIRLEIILKGRKLGFGLMDIKAMIDARAQWPRGTDETPPSDPASLAAPGERAELEQRVRQLEAQKRRIEREIDALTSRLAGHLVGDE